MRAGTYPDRTLLRYISPTRYSSQSCPLCWAPRDTWQHRVCTMCTHSEMRNLTTERHNVGARHLLRALRRGRHGNHLTIANIGNSDNALDSAVPATRTRDEPIEADQIRHERTIPTWLLPCTCQLSVVCSCPARLCPDILICHGLTEVPTAPLTPTRQIQIQFIEFCFSIESGDILSVSSAFRRKINYYREALRAIWLRGWGIYGACDPTNPNTMLPDTTALVVGTCAAIPVQTIDALTTDCGLTLRESHALATQWVSAAAGFATSLLTTHARLARNAAAATQPTVIAHQPASPL